MSVAPSGLGGLDLLTVKWRKTFHQENHRGMEMLSLGVLAGISQLRPGAAGQAGEADPNWRLSLQGPSGGQGQEVHGTRWVYRGSAWVSGE